MPLRSLAAVVFPALLLFSVPAAAQGLRYVQLNIGQGDSALVVAPSGCAALLDGGPTGSGAVIKAYLMSIGVTQIDFAIMSHHHADHLGGIDEVEQGTNAVPIAAVFDRGGSYSSTAFTQYANQFAGRRNTVHVGQVISLCSEVTFTVVAENGNSLNTSDENTLSVVVKMTYGAFDAVIGGDATGDSGDDLETLIAPDVGEVELYKVHHHGSRYSSNNNFLDATMPTVSFISVGNNSYGHPTPEALARLEAHGSDIWQTQDSGGHIVLTSANGSSYTVDQGNRSTTYQSKGQSGDTEPPTAPADLAANAVSTSEIDLSWSASADNVGVTEYRVYRSTNGSSFSLAGTATSTGFADLGLQSGTTYWYRVTARDAAGNESAVSNTAQAATPPEGPDATPPTAPSSLSASAVSKSQINLGWSAATDNVGVTGYQIYRSLDGTTFSSVGTAAGTSYSDTGLASWTTYWYRVTAVDAAANESAPSNTASARTKRK